MAKTKILLNQVGYITQAAKTGTVIGGGASFLLYKKGVSGAVYKGELELPTFDIASGDMTSTADFSDFTDEGEFYMKVGNKKSYPFVISKKPYAKVALGIQKAFYFARCGCELTEKYAGRYRRKKCHCKTAAHLTSGERFDVTGGWHDGGDYGRLVVSAATALGHLLYAYEFFPENFERSANIPESGSGMSDLLGECRYELTWLLKMQSKDGGVYHKVETKEYADNIMPAEDTAELYLFDRSLAATANFAAAMALAARVFQKSDEVFSKRMKTAALNAWVWLVNNKDRTFNDPPEKIQTEEWNQKNLNDDIFWAAAELYRLTGESSFEERLLEIYDRVNTTAFTWANVGGFGAVSYIFGNRTQNPLLVDGLMTAFLYRADNIVSMSRHSGYGTAKEGNRYLWGSNMEILTFAMTLIIANKISPNKDYITAALEQVNYILGKNPIGISYVTGFGVQSCTHPHHRPSTADDIDEPIPGLVAGGPDMLRNDEYVRWLIPQGTPPAKCYIDKEYSYSCNEVSIYWNSPAVFVFGFFSEGI